MAVSKKTGYERLFEKIIKLLDKNKIKYELNKLFCDEGKEGDFNHMYEAHFWLYEFDFGFQVINSSSYFMENMTIDEQMDFQSALSVEMVDKGHWIGVFFDYELDEDPIKILREYFKEVYEVDILEIT